MSTRMTRSDMQLRIIEEARRRGLDPANLSPAQYKAIQWSLLSHDPVAAVIGAATAAASAVNTSLGLSVVSEERATANRIVCENCPSGKYRALRVRRHGTYTGETVPACDACSCHDRLLVSKWRDAVLGICPMSHWDNRVPDHAFLRRLTSLFPPDPDTGEPHPVATRVSQSLQGGDGGAP